MSPRNIFETAADMKNHHRRRRRDEQSTRETDSDDGSSLQPRMESHHRKQPCRQLLPTSRGKSLAPTGKHKPKDTATQVTITRKRRRCLPLSKTATATVRIKSNFPGKLFKLVESCTDSNNPILSWLASRNHAADHVDNTNSTQQKMQSLVVWDKGRFLDHHLVKTSFASQSTFRSFERQLNSWGFKRDHTLEETLLANQQEMTKDHVILIKESLRAFYHPSFQEKRPDLLQGVKRRPPGSGNKGIKQTIVASNIANVATTTNATTLTTEKNKDHSAAAAVSLPDQDSSSPSSSISSSTHEDSIRTDIVLPSGVCLRINRRIPEWAIPAQEAAIQYLFQKHSDKDLHGKASLEQREPTFSMVSDETRRIPNGDNRQNSLGDTGHRPRMAKEEEEERSIAFPKQQRSDFQDSLGSLLQQSQQRTFNNAELILDEDRFDDASEDEEEATLQRHDDTKTEKGETGYKEDHANDDEEYLVI